MSVSNIPTVILNIAQSIRENNGRAVLVGGCVRDALLGYDTKDWDLEVFGLQQERLEAILAKWGCPKWVGKAFGVYKLEAIGLDVSLPRSDQPTGSGHRDFDVTIDPTLTFESAAKRRDLTINSMGFDPLTGELLDPYGGQNDLAQGILRATDASRFAEDPLRGLRVAQMTARFLMKPDPVLYSLCKKLSFEHLSKERYWWEFEKLLLKGQRPSLGLEFLKETDLLRFFPELKALINVPQDKKYHAEGDVWIHTLMVVDKAARLRDMLSWKHEEDRLTLMFGALCHDLGKPACTVVEEEAIRSRGHDVAGEDLAQQFMQRLAASHQLTGKVKALVRWHLAPVLLPGHGAEKPAYRRLALRLSEYGVSMALLWRLAWADQSGRIAPEYRAKSLALLRTFRRVVREIDVWLASPPDVVTGKFLLTKGYAAGPEFGKILSKCREIQDHEGLTDAQTIFEIYESQQ